jgi:hypothetical protein
MFIDRRRVILVESVKVAIVKKKVIHAPGKK